MSKIKTVFITGATSGIGRATAYLLAKEKYRLILCGRRKDRLNDISKTLSSLSEIFTLCFDIRNKDEVAEAIQSLPKVWKNIDILINNAGNAHGLSPIQNGDINDWDAMININVKGLLYVSKIILPGMVARNSGHVINIGSIAGLEVYPNGNVYCASKYAVDAITKGMRMDLNAHNIKVTSINPGLVETEFSLVRFKGDKEKAKAVYDGITPLSADDIAEVIHFILSRPNHVNIADLLILPTSQASATIVNREQF
jgi:3-hydroxy acid dehydrogenase/malonic semialdehyde reductase